MPQSPSTLARKTKAEILAEYEKLIKNLETAKDQAAQAHEPKVEELIGKAKEISVEKIRQSVDALRIKINEYVDKLGDALSVGTKEVQQLSQTVEALQKRLEHEHNIEIAAEALTALVADYEAKKRQFALESKQQEMNLQLRLEDQERQWQRGKEDKQYELERTLRQKRGEFEEDFARQEHALQEREQQLQQQEAEIQGLRQTIETFPQVSEKRQAEYAKELTARLQNDHEQVLNQAAQEWEAQKNLLELKISNLQEHIKRQQAEINTLKQEAERANKRTQELAIKVIEGGTSVQPEKSKHAAGLVS